MTNARWKLLAALLLGILLGAGGAGAFVRAWYERLFASMYVSAAASQAFTAREIYAGRGAELADRIKTSLPIYVGAIQREFRREEGRDGALWVVSDVYTTSGTQAPEELKTLFASLPPRPSRKVAVPR